MKTTDMTKREFAICKAAATEIMRLVNAGLKYDVASKTWVPQTQADRDATAALVAKLAKRPARRAR
jgi:fructose-1,6-bisphosphatase/inositol monophosphatase family enzyme